MLSEGRGEGDGGQMAFPCFGSSFGRCFDLTCTHVKTNSNARELFLVQTFKFFRSLAEIQNPLPWSRRGGCVRRVPLVAIPKPESGVIFPEPTG